MSVASRIDRKSAIPAASAVEGNTAASGAALPPNLLVNPEFAGAVAGSPGTAPTDWLYSTVGTPATTVDGAAITFDATASRIIAYQAHSMVIGTYELESTVTASGAQLVDLLFTNDWDGFTTFIDGVEVPYTTAVNGTKRLKVRVVITTGRSINIYLGIGLQGSATGTATHTAPTLRQVA